MLILLSKATTNFIAKLYPYKNAIFVPIFIFKSWLNILNGDCVGECFAVCDFGVLV